MQNSNVFNRQLKNSFLKKNFHGMNYQGSYELDFLEKFYHIGISKCETIEYFFNGKERIYYPDFYYKEKILIIEIKSDYTFNKYLDINLAKQKSCIEGGYSFIFIINKDYSKFRQEIK